MKCSFTLVSFLYNLWYQLLLLHLSNCCMLLESEFLVYNQRRRLNIEGHRLWIIGFRETRFVEFVLSSCPKVFVLKMSIDAIILIMIHFFVDERLNDIVGSAYYVAPEVLHRAYSTEADVWSIGVIAYILLCGSRPFWARTESGIFRAVVKAEPTYEEQPWPTLSLEAKDFVKRLLNKDPRKRMSAAQAMCKYRFLPSLS